MRRILERPQGQYILTLVDLLNQSGGWSRRCCALQRNEDEFGAIQGRVVGQGAFIHLATSLP